MPELPAGYRSAFPSSRPTGLRRRSFASGSELWRVDGSPPRKWKWTGFPDARYRFDPESGAFRTRYANQTIVGTFRERYRSSGLVIPSDHAGHYLVRLVATRNLRVLDLRTERNLDVLQLDDQISTGQHPDVWATCHRLAEAVRSWWADIDAIVYRSRTTPETSLNFAFFADDAFDIDCWTLRDRSNVLTDLVLHQGFTVNWDLGAK